MMIVQSSPTQVRFFANDHLDDLDWASIGAGMRVASLSVEDASTLRAWQDAFEMIPVTDPQNPPHPPCRPMGNQVVINEVGEVRMLHADGSPRLAETPSPDGTHHEVLVRGHLIVH